MSAGDVRVCSHGLPLNWPQEIWIGIHDAEWPIQAFGHPDQAAHWVADDPKYRHAFRVDGSITAKVRFVPAVPASHDIVPIDGEDHRL